MFLVDARWNMILTSVFPPDASYSTLIRPDSCSGIIENKESPIISQIIHISNSYLFFKSLYMGCHGRHLVAMVIWLPSNSKMLIILCLGASPMGVIHCIILETTQIWRRDHKLEFSQVALCINKIICDIHDNQCKSTLANKYQCDIWIIHEIIGLSLFSIMLLDEPGLTAVEIERVT